MSRTIGSTVALIIFMVGPDLCFATKCFNAKTTSEFIESFPVVVRGKITHREKSQENANGYTLKIEVTAILKGDFKYKNVEAMEEHFDKSMASPHVYRVEQEYVFPIRPDKKSGYEILLPVDGCPDLPH